jgi:hypothetical protein
MTGRLLESLFFCDQANQSVYLAFVLDPGSFVFAEITRIKMLDFSPETLRRAPREQVDPLQAFRPSGSQRNHSLVERDRRRLGNDAHCLVACLLQREVAGAASAKPKMFQMAGNTSLGPEVGKVEYEDSALAQVTEGFHAIGIGAVTDHGKPSAFAL